jgi:rhodanese-related sulfurtransferase
MFASPQTLEIFMSSKLSLSELTARRDANLNLILVEALPEKYFRQGHLPGARHVPHDQVDQLAPTLLSDRSAEIVVYCASDTCRNSDIAAQTLDRLGYTHVAVFSGGKQAWVEAGLPLDAA